MISYEEHCIISDEGDEGGRGWNYHEGRAGQWSGIGGWRGECRWLQCEYNTTYLIALQYLSLSTFSSLFQIKEEAHIDYEEETPTQIKEEMESEGKFEVVNEEIRVHEDDPVGTSIVQSGVSNFIRKWCSLI